MFKMNHKSLVHLKSIVLLVQILLEFVIQHKLIFALNIATHRVIVMKEIVNKNFEYILPVNVSPFTNLMKRWLIYIIKLIIFG